MRILSRCSDILVANINALLDKAEKPEAMIGQVNWTM
jgi:phage shock protein A